jgi:hypothetical protein
LTRDTATLATCQEQDGRRASRTVGQVALGVRLYDAEPAADAADRLAAAFAELRAALPGGLAPLQISLPDPAVSLQLLELDALPARRSEREALVRWRFAKALAREADRLACAWQPLGSSGGKHYVLATAIERVRIDPILAACRQAGLVPTTLGMSANYYFNGFHDQWTSGEHGALLIIEPASWTLMLWDAERRPCFLRSRWREATGGADYDTIVADAERHVRAYVHGGPGRGIARVMIAGGERAALIDHLGASPRFPCAALDPAGCFATGASSTVAARDEACAAWMASLPR